jgi:hypothetical protein
VVIALVLTCAGVAHAERFKVGLWGGTVGVSNTGVDRFVTSFGTQVGKYTVKGTTLDSIARSSLYGLDAGYEFYPNFVIGARIFQLSSVQDISSNGIAFNPFTGVTGEYDINFDMAMTPLLVGGALTLPITEKFAFTGQVYLGYALTEARLGVRERGLTNELSFSGSGTASDVSGELRYALSSRASLSAGLHLFAAKASDLSGSAAWPNNSSSTLAIDYNNVSFTLGMNLSF